MKKVINAFDVIEALAKSQGERYPLFIETAQCDWDPDMEGLAFIGFTFDLSQHKDDFDWASFFATIEQVLTDSKYEKYVDRVYTMVLESLSNKVSNGALKAEYLTEHAGPLARAHMRNWELAMDGKTIF